MSAGRRGGVLRPLVTTALVWGVLVGGALLLWRTTSFPGFLVVLAGFVAFFCTLCDWLPRIVARSFSSRPSARERITRERSWQSTSSTEEALRRGARALERENGRCIRAEAGLVEYAFGSDEKFRRWGIGLEWGRRALPLVVTLRAEAAEGGSRLGAAARDDLGWYLGSALNRTVGPDVVEITEGILDRVGAALGEAAPSSTRDAPG